MIRNLVELSEVINERNHCYTCPNDSPCDEVIAFCKVIIEHCEKLKEEALKNAPKEEVIEVPPEDVKIEEPQIEVIDVGCCNG